MSEHRTLLPTLDRLFAGPRESVLTIHAFLQGLGERSYAFVIAALDLPNCIPTGIPLLSAVTGIPMLFLLAEEFSGRGAALLPLFVGRRGIQRGRLQDFLVKARPRIVWLEERIHPRRDWWVSGTPRLLLFAAWTFDIVILALPIPFDNLVPAWAILFFCLALLEGDGIMAMMGWALTVLTAAWTVVLAFAYPYFLLKLFRMLF